MSYNDVVQAIADAEVDAQTLGDVVNGAPNIQIKTRLGRYIWTLATIGYKVEIVNQQANAAIAEINQDKSTVNSATSTALNNIQAASNSVQGELNAKLNELDNAINTAGAAGAGANGWKAVFVADKSGLNQQQINDGIASLNDLKAIDPKTANVKVLLNSVVLGKGLGGGTFVSVLKGSLVPDGGTIIESANTGYVWQRIGYDYVTPEMFSALGEGADEYTQVQAAVNTGKTVYLDKIYAISKCIKTAVVGQQIFGKNRKTSGLIAKSDVWVNTPNNGVIRVAHDKCYLHDFVADANNVGSAPSNRTNGCYVAGDNGTQPTGWTIERVDALNATGYAHVCFGAEANPLTSGLYVDCYAENSQVLFEQLACHTVTLINCNAVATSRTVEGFHPYASVQNITYINCKLIPKSDTEYVGVGINIVSTNNYDLGLIRFINCDVLVNGGVSAVSIDTATNKGKIQFIGGSYKSDKGAGFVANGVLDIGVYAGAKFEGASGFNCPVTAGARVTINHSDIQSTLSTSDTSYSNALITNGCDVTVSGGSIVAKGGAGQVAIRGNAIVSAETRLIPANTSNSAVIKSQGHGRVNFTVDTGAFCFANIPVNSDDLSKFHLSLSVNNASVQYPQQYSLNWTVVDSTLIRVYANGLDGNAVLNYHWIKFA